MGRAGVVFAEPFMGFAQNGSQPFMNESFVNLVRPQFQQTGIYDKPLALAPGWRGP
jgi:hypothetical protein